ncbi:MAG TPA: hypothetical protein VJ372_06750 [Pyrinomonadaceae bacterium]|nr:hypothetical protein [Pyrinomonadaceae bacterium]
MPAVPARASVKSNEPEIGERIAQVAVIFSTIAPLYFEGLN